MFTILKGGQVLAPDDMGRKDLVLAGGKIVHIGEAVSTAPVYGPVTLVDVSGCFVVPGFIDHHVHLIGGGGEGGFATRTPEVTLSRITRAGITTVVGCLGTDGVTRHMTSLLAKARALEEEGVSTYIYTGSYEVPTSTITGNVREDIVLIDKVVGCGEIAISDHRSAQPLKEEITRLAAEIRVGGLLSGKAGVLHLHVGSGVRGLSMLFEILSETEIPISQFTPTHLGRNPQLLAGAVKFAQMGGMVDFTAGSGAGQLSTAQAVKYCLDQGVGVDRITLSSDGNGSLPRFDADGKYLGLDVAELDSLYQVVKELVQENILSLSDGLRLITENPAVSLKIPQGKILPGGMGDITVLDENLNIRHVFAKGQWMVQDGKPIVLGVFEK